MDTYVTWEHGRHSPSIRHLPIIVRQLGYDPTSAECGSIDDVEWARRLGGVLLNS
ncbi:MAG: hypothetical protein ABL973_09025 [Micropepsaceae bacterium]